MPLSRILPDFSVSSIADAPVMSDVSLEDEKLASYETGYKAGWDDSSAANKDAGDQIEADFSQNIRDISMTYHEAYTALLGEIRPLLTQIVESILPAIAQESLAPRVVELIESHIATGRRTALVLSSAPTSISFLQPMVDRLGDDLDLELREDETLGSGQVHLSFGPDVEEELDTAALLDGIQTAVRGFFENQDEGAPQIDLTKETA